MPKFATITPLCRVYEGAGYMRENTVLLLLQLLLVNILPNSILQLTIHVVTPQQKQSPKSNDHTVHCIGTILFFWPLTLINTHATQSLQQYTFWQFNQVLGYTGYKAFYAKNWCCTLTENLNSYYLSCKNSMLCHRTGRTFITLNKGQWSYNAFCNAQ